MAGEWWWWEGWRAPLDRLINFTLTLREGGTVPIKCQLRREIKREDQLVYLLKFLHFSLSHIHARYSQWKNICLFDIF